MPDNSRPGDMRAGDPVGAELLNADGEVVVQLANGWTLRSGVYDRDYPGARLSGEYVRLCTPDGAEHLYWDQEEWRADPGLVMGAIINSAAGLRLDHEPVPADPEPGEYGYEGPECHDGIER